MVEPAGKEKSLFLFQIATIRQRTFFAALIFLFILLATLLFLLAHTTPRYGDLAGWEDVASTITNDGVLRIT